MLLFFYRLFYVFALFVKYLRLIIYRSQIAREFAEGRVHMEKSIFNLKDVVGIKRLVDAVFVGIK